MSRMSLRRQVLYRNVDRYAEETAPPVRGHGRTYGDQEAADEELQLIISQMEEQQEAENQSQETGNQSMMAKFPVDKDDVVPNQPHTAPEARRSLYDPVNATYAEPWTPSLPGNGASSIPQTPRFPVENSTPLPGVHRNDSPSRIFRFPDRYRGSTRDYPVPMSPIPSRPSIRNPLSQPGRRPRALDREVPALPMSPVAFLVQTPVSTFPPDSTMLDPLCQSVLEETLVDHERLNSLSLPTWGQMCRICHEDGGRERLVSPCHCKGTMGMLHMDCLERWLGTSNTTKCEICAFQFSVEKCPRPFKWYLTEPRLKRERKPFLTDVILSAVLLILVIVICILCFIFGLILTKTDRHVSSTILILVAVVSCFLYAVWSWRVFPRIQRQWDAWKTNYFVIYIKDDNNSQAKANDHETRKKKHKTKLKTATEIAMSERPLHDEDSNNNV